MKLRVRADQQVTEEVLEEWIVICAGVGSLILVTVIVVDGHSTVLIAGGHVLIITMNTLKHLGSTASSLVTEKDKLP